MKFDTIKQMPLAPATLDEVASLHWETIMRPLIKNRLVSSVDLPILEMACVMYSSWMHAEEMDKSAYAKDYLSIMSKYGATPKARQGILAEEKSVKGDAPRKEKKTRADDDLLGGFGL